MSKKAWIIVLVLVGVGLAVVLGVLANSQSVAEKQYCNSVDALESALATLTALDPSTVSQDSLQSDISSVQSAWGDVKSDAADLPDANQDDLDNAWDAFSDAVGNLNDGGSAQDVESAAQSLATAAQANAESYDCSDTSTTTTSS